MRIEPNPCCKILLRTTIELGQSFSKIQGQAFLFCYRNIDKALLKILWLKDCQDPIKGSCGKPPCYGSQGKAERLGDRKLLNLISSIDSIDLSLPCHLLLHQRRFGWRGPKG